MVILLFQLAVALGMAWGWSAVLERGGQPSGSKGERPRAPLDRVIVVLAILLGAVLLVFVLGQDVWRSGYVALATARKSASSQPFSSEAAAFAYRAFVGDLRNVTLLGLLALACAFLAARGRLRAPTASAIALGLIVIELWPVSGRVMKPVIGDPVQRNLDIGRDDVVEFLEAAGPPGSFRVLPVREILSNRYSGFGIASIAGYHAAKPRLFQDLVDADLLWPTGGGPGFNLAWLSLLNVRYIAMPERLQNPPLYLKEVFAGSSTVYENLVALPSSSLPGPSSTR
jgi:hypothetical protein